LRHHQGPRFQLLVVDVETEGLGGGVEVGAVDEDGAALGRWHEQVRSRKIVGDRKSSEQSVRVRPGRMAGTSGRGRCSAIAAATLCTPGWTGAVGDPRDRRPGRRTIRFKRVRVKQSTRLCGPEKLNPWSGIIGRARDSS